MTNYFCNVYYTHKRSGKYLQYIIFEKLQHNIINPWTNRQHLSNDTANFSAILCYQSRIYFERLTVAAYWVLYSTRRFFREAIRSLSISRLFRPYIPHRIFHESAILTLMLKVKLFYYKKFIFSMNYS